LSTINFFLWHVYVINKEDFLGIVDLGSKQVLTFGVQVALKSVLKIFACCFTGEVYKCRVNLIGSRHKELFYNYRLSNTGFASHKNVESGVHQCGKNVLILNCIVGWNKNIEKVSLGIELEDRNLSSPRLEFMCCCVYAVFEHVTVWELREVRTELTSENSSKGSS